MDSREKIKYSIKFKIFIILIITITFISTTFGFFFVTKTNNSLIRELEKRGTSEAVSLAYDAAYGTFTEDETILAHLVSGRMQKPDIEYIVITKGDGTVLVDNRDEKVTLFNTGNKSVYFDKAPEKLHDSSTPLSANLKHINRNELMSDKGENIYEYTVPIKTMDLEPELERSISEDFLLFSKERKESRNVPLGIGSVKIGYSLKRIENEIIETLSISAITIIIITIIAMIVSCYFVSRIIIKPIREIADTAVEISRGDFSKRVEMKSMDEIGLMANNFNKMTTKLNNAIKELEGLKNYLEEKVNKRTKDLETSNMKLEKAYKKLMSLDEMKSQFFCNVSHEFKTPLTSIVGYAKIMRNSIQEEIVAKINLRDLCKGENEQFWTEIDDTQKGLRVIIDEGERLTRLINNILDLAKMEAGKFDWNDENVSLLDVVSFSKSNMSFLLDENGLNMVVESDKDIPVVLCDRDRITQVFVNLISNAIKFSNHGASIKCFLRNKGEKLEVNMMDNGIGISKEDLPEIFNKFKQAGNNSINRSNGTGLGLAICKEIIHHYGGDIWAESEVGKGSSFAFTLPVARYLEKV